MVIKKVKKEVYNGFLGVLAPCSTVRPRTSGGAIVELPKCALETFEVYRDTAHYFGLDVPYCLRKEIKKKCRDINFGRTFTVLPPKCHTCPLSKYRPCYHKKATILEHQKADKVFFEVQCPRCGINVNNLNDLSVLPLLQPITSTKVKTQLGGFYKYSYNRRK